MRLVTCRTDNGRTAAARVEGAELVELPHRDVGALLAHPDWRSLAGEDGPRRPYDHGQLAPVIPVPPKIWCVGLNYADHAAEAAKPALEFPTLFAKFAVALAGPRDPLCLPAVSSQVDWEVELAFVIGRAGEQVPAADAMGYVAGFTVMNDVSMRDWQRRTQQYLQGKTFARSTPLGPELVTVDEAPDPYAGMAISCRVNGEVVQSASTEDMIFGVCELVEYISMIAPLEPGDVIATGTPAGIGALRSPPRFLRPGDAVECAVEGIGELGNRCVASRR